MISEKKKQTIHVYYSFNVIIFDFRYNLNIHQMSKWSSAQMTKWMSQWLCWNSMIEKIRQTN